MPAKPRAPPGKSRKERFPHDLGARQVVRALPAGREALRPARGDGHRAGPARPPADLPAHHAPGSGRAAAPRPSGPGVRLCRRAGGPAGAAAQVLSHRQPQLRLRPRAHRHPRDRRVHAHQLRAVAADREASRVRQRAALASGRDRGSAGSGAAGGRGGARMSTAAVQVAKILLIDSNVFFAKRLGDALKHEGFEVVHSTQSAYALTMVEYDTPTAILCATNLREMGAFEISRILHADAKTAQIPIIAMGEGEEQALMEAYRAD